MDLSRIEYPTGTFSYATTITVLPEINFSNARTLTNVFSNCTRLKKITKFVLGRTNTSFSGTFANCNALKEITIEGVIGQNIDLSPCPLTKESILSVITHLSDTSASKTLSLKASAVNNIDWTNTVIDDVTYNSFDEICDLKQNWTISLI